MSHIVGVLAVQGAFIEHEKRLEELGASCVELRQAADLERPFDRLVLPGGESTAQAKMLHELGMFDKLRERIAAGMPVLATCAGLILLAERLEDDPTVHFGTLPVTVRRNAYGRQLGSFHTKGTWLGGTKGQVSDATAPDVHSCEAAPVAGSAGNQPTSPDPADTLPATFIRAPRITELRGQVRPLVTLGDGTVAAVRCENQLACAFHPELDDDPRIHELFLAL